VNTWLARAVTAAIVVLGATRVDAQITTVIAPPKRAEAKHQEAARVEAVAQDSIARVTLTGMKEWVDSAAGALAIRPDTGTAPSADSAARPASSRNRQLARSDSAAAARPGATLGEFREGARAPNTATAVPSLALAGAVLLLLGLALGRRSSRVTR